MRLFLCACLVLLASAVACGGSATVNIGAGPSGTGGSVTPTRDPLQAKLASVLLTSADLPAGMDAGSLSYSTNTQLAQTPDELDQLNQRGRMLGVDESFVPNSQLPEGSPLRGGVQSSASVYTNPDGASETFKEKADAARSTDWSSSYSELSDLNVRELDQRVGDETLWLRITGVDTCIIETPPGLAPGEEVPSATCPPSHLIVDDYVVFRSGRVHVLVRVLSSQPLDSPTDEVYVDEVRGWAELVAQRATQVFPLVP